MIHSVENCERRADHPVLKLPTWWCPVCKRPMYGDQPGGECGWTPPPPPSLACIHRRKPLPEKVPCGECAKTGRAVMVTTYLCVFNNLDRACSLRDVERADVTYCGACGDREKPAVPPVA